MYLEDKPKLEQFILSDLIDYISNTSVNLKLDNIPNWNILHHRKCLVKVINHLKNLHIIKVVDELNSFTEDVHAEGLFETTGLSNYYVREFKNDILEYSDIKDYVNDEFSNQDDKIGDVRRYKVYRSLLYSLVSYTEDLTEFEMDYLRKFRNSINNELNKYTLSELELTRNMALLMYDDETKEKFDFPNNKAICDIVLLINDYILDKVNNSELELNKDETIIITKESMNRIIKDVRSNNLKYFSKYYREMIIDTYIIEVINYLKEYDVIREYDLGYKIYPIVSKLTGYIPKDDKEQMNLFEEEV